MCSPETCPVMSKTIQNACQEFPKSAINLVSQHGFDLEEFSELQDKLKVDAVFRYRVKNQINKVNKEKNN